MTFVIYVVVICFHVKFVAVNENTATSHVYWKDIFYCDNTINLFKDMKLWKRGKRGGRKSVRQTQMAKTELREGLKSLSPFRDENIKYVPHVGMNVIFQSWPIFGSSALLNVSVIVVTLADWQPKNYIQVTGLQIIYSAHWILLNKWIYYFIGDENIYTSNMNMNRSVSKVL